MRLIKRGFKLRSTVNAIVFATVLATLTISSVVAYRSEKQSLTRTTLQLNQVYGDKMSDTVNDLFVNLKQSLAVTGDFLATDMGRTDLHDQLILFRRSHSSFNSVFIIDKDGFVLDGSNTDSNAKKNKITSDGITQALQVQQPLISEPYISATNKLIVMVSYPLFDPEGKYVGFIGGSIRLHETNIFQTVLGNKSYQSNGSYAYVVSSTGLLLYHPDESRIGEKVVGNPIVDKVLAGQSGTGHVVNSKGLSMLASYSFVKEGGWGIVAQTPEEVVLSASRELVFKIVLYMLPAMLAFMILIYWVIGKLSAPLSKLATFASQLSPSNSGGDEPPVIHAFNYEANELHKAIGRAVRHFRYQFDNVSMEAQTDPLTGLYNRRMMDRFVKNWIAQSVPFSIMVMDLDNFKRVNDTYGHDKGDEVLKFLAISIRRLLSEASVCCRFGGEEFVVLIPNENFENALCEAEKIREFMAETSSPTGDKVTLSIGLAHYPGFASNAEQLFHIADEALYRAKRLGRNRVEIAHEAVFEGKTS
ncbi:sensor domain-containing diguanylate cyclase [Cohnella lupini]|uniref:Diguanylate cyclase (GGDEF)-like protein n=1 Tax=Cohnella lupini TaxID=1294267 RepID=A0A3D9IQN3_9BACL|nr:sensor domain-containing diguanylate cyclase [Cohnella lupini]RED64052.1 diguanylate cyclase (GGDEF)-like protein [Cohnella lupini]